ncbi:MAG: conjugal transfer protein TraG N-terminal domain-containing protein, partial [Alphaproteobacteria bacterium]|nr:conjugal transfer protein TraG N-terminal domain-containing protein [Alphaproteobacteria bacterium]
FIIPYLLLPGGTKALLRWFHMILWVQMWPPLFAILNFIMNVAAAKSSIAATSGVLSIATTVGMTEANADIAAQAGYLALSVPVIAWAIIQGGVSSLSQALSYVTGVTQGVANKAGEEMVHGNMSMGNVSLGTVQAHNTTQGQTLKSPSLTSGAMLFNDGHMNSTHSADGSVIHNVGVSQLPSNVNMGETFSNAYTKMSNQSATMSQQHSQAASQSEAQASRQVYDFANHLSKSQNYSDSNNTSENASAQQSAKKLLSASEDFAKNHNISTNEAADLLISAGGGFKFLGNGANTQMKGSSAAGKHKLISEAQNYAKQNGLDKTTSHLIQASQDERVSKNDEQGKRYSEGLNQSIEKATQHRKEESLSLQKSNSFSEQAQMAKQNSAGFTQNMNQQYIEWLKEQSIDGKGSMGSQAALTLVANDPHKNNMYLNRFVEDQVSKQANYFDQQGIQNTQSIETLHSNAHKPKMQLLTPTEHPYQKAEYSGLTQIPTTIDQKTSNISTKASNAFKDSKNTINNEEKEQMQKRAPVIEEFNIRKDSALMKTAGDTAYKNVKESLENAKKYKKTLDVRNKNRK